MAFALYALLGPDAPPMTADSLLADINKHFAAEKDLSIDIREATARHPAWAASAGAFARYSATIHRARARTKPSS